MAVLLLLAVLTLLALLLAFIESIVARLRAKDYGFRELVHEIAQNKAFQSK